MVPLTEGRFDLDDYIDYVISILHFLGGDVHVIAVCQPSVPVLAAVARMEAADDPYVPRSMVLMGGPIDTRVNPTGVNQLAKFRGIDWFRRNVITKVPFPHPGMMRRCSSWIPAAQRLRQHEHRSPHRRAPQAVPEPRRWRRRLRTEAPRILRRVHLAVMDLTAEFYLQTVETVFVRHALPQGPWTTATMSWMPRRSGTSP